MDCRTPTRHPCASRPVIACGRKFHCIVNNAMTFVARNALRDTQPPLPP